MPVGGKHKHTGGLGRAIFHSQKKTHDAAKALHSSGKQRFLEGAESGISCLEASNLTDFLAKAELANAEFESIRGRVELIEKSVVEKSIKKEGMSAEEAKNKGKSAIRRRTRVEMSHGSCDMIRTVNVICD